MRIANFIAMAALAGALARAGEGNSPDLRTMTAYLVDHRLDSNCPVLLAEGAATRIYSTLGFDLRWRSGRPRATDPHAMVFVIELTDRSSSDKYKGALAFALPYEGVHIQVFYDRVWNLDPISPNMLLAHVFVHEIAHLLQGVEHHSSTGIMKASYTVADARRMRTRVLPFTPEDVLLIQMGVSARWRPPVLVSASASARPQKLSGR